MSSWQICFFFSQIKRDSISNYLTWKKALQISCYYRNKRININLAVGLLSETAVYRKLINTFCAERSENCGITENNGTWRHRHDRSRLHTLVAMSNIFMANLYFSNVMSCSEFTILYLVQMYLGPIYTIFLLQQWRFFYYKSMLAFALHLYEMLVCKAQHAVSN